MRSAPSSISRRAFRGEAADSQILISSRIFSKVETAIDMEPLGELPLKGFNRPVPAYNVVAMRAL